MEGAFDDIAGIYDLTPDQIAHQMSPAMLAFVALKKDRAWILAAPFEKQSKAFQGEYIRISTLYEMLKRRRMMKSLSPEADLMDMVRRSTVH